MRASRFFAATGVRLAVIQTVLLVCAFWVAGSLTRFSTTYIYRQGVEKRLASESATLAALYQSRGIGEVAAAVTSGERRPGGLEYRLIDPGGRLLAGDLPPTGAPLGLTFLDWDDAHVPGRPYQDLVVDNTRLPDGSILTVGQDLTDEGKLRHTLRNTLFWCGGAGAVVGLVLSYLLARGVLRRVDGVVAAARAVSAGQMTVRAPRRKALLPDDIDDLGASFNTMLDEIAALVDRVRFVSTGIAHDLRTPLTHVRQKLERVRIAANGDAAVLAAAADVEADVDELLRVFDAMLRLAEIESGPLAARFKPLDLAELAGRIADAYRPDIEAGGRWLSTSLAPAVVLGDADLIGQAIGNLLENALRHTPVGSRITLAVDTDGGRPRLRVSDDGPGIPESKRQDVLRHFYRLEASRTTPGSGLGLAIVAAVAGRHGAQVELLDAAPGLTVLITFCCGIVAVPKLGPNVMSAVQGHALPSLAVLATIAVWSSPTVTVSQDLRSTRDMAALPPAEADRVVRRDLLSILTPIKHRLGGGIMIRIDDVALAGVRPYGTEFSGLCRSDTLVLKYAPVEGRSGLRDQPLQPYGFEASARFHAVRVPAPPAKDYRREDYIWSSECDRLGEDAGWFQAEDAAEAATGVNFLKAAIDAVGAGKIEPISCERLAAEHRACRDIVLSEGDIRKITSVARCAAGAGAACYRIETAGYIWLEIVGTAAGDDSIEPGAVTSIKLGYFIVVT